MTDAPAAAARVDAMFADLRDEQQSMLRVASRLASLLAMFDRSRGSLWTSIRQMEVATAALAARVAAMEAVLSRLKAIGPPGG